MESQKSILDWLLKNCNDGRKKTFYCLAVNLLELEEIKKVTDAHIEEDGNQELLASLNDFQAKDIFEYSDWFDENEFDTRDKAIDFFLKQCSRWCGIGNSECIKNDGMALFLSSDESEDNYILNKRYNPVENDISKIIIQNEKLKIFYIKSGETDALITCFKEEISKNKSEFRNMPEDEAVFQKDNYNEIYKLHNGASINKFGGVESISVDKFNLSKFLGKHLRIGGMIEDKVESKFEEDVLKIFDIRTLKAQKRLKKSIIK